MASEEPTLKRMFIGGLYDTVTDEDLKQRFGRFGAISDVDIKVRFDENGKPMKTFAYLDITTDDKNYNQCVQMYNKTKWKGAEVQIQLAKQSFIDRLKREREVQAKAEADEARRKKHSKSEEDLSAKKPNDMIIKGVAPGKPIEGKKNWVVGKYGRALPVVHIRSKTKQKVITVDPSKFCHSLKKLDQQDGKTGLSDTKVTNLMWSMDEDKPQSQRMTWFADIPSHGKKPKSDQDMSLATVKLASKRRKSSGYQSGTDTESDSSQGTKVKMRSKKSKKKREMQSSDSSDSELESELPFGMKKTDLSRHLPAVTPQVAAPPVIDDFEVVSTEYFTKNSGKPQLSDSEDTDDMLTSIKNKKQVAHKSNRPNSRMISSKTSKTLSKARAPSNKSQNISSSSSDESDALDQSPKTAVGNSIHSADHSSSDSECPDELLSHLVKKTAVKCSKPVKTAGSPKKRDSRKTDEQAVETSPAGSSASRKKRTSLPITPHSELPASASDDILSLSQKLQAAAQAGDVSNILELTNKLQSAVRESTPSTGSGFSSVQSASLTSRSSSVKTDVDASPALPSSVSIHQTPAKSKSNKTTLSSSVQREMEYQRKTEKKQEAKSPTGNSKTVKVMNFSSSDSSDEEIYAMRDASKFSGSNKPVSADTPGKTSSHASINEFSGGLDETPSKPSTDRNVDSDSMDDDLLDLVATGKVHKLRKMASDIENKFTKTKKSPVSKNDVSASVVKETKKSNTSMVKEKVQSKASIVKEEEKPNTSIVKEKEKSKKPKKLKVDTDVKLSETKSQQFESGTKRTVDENNIKKRTVSDKKSMHSADNKKRLDSLRQRKEEQSSKQSIIQQALAQVDSKSSTKIKFDSDDDDEDYQSRPITMEMESSAASSRRSQGRAERRSVSDESDGDSSGSSSDEDGAAASAAGTGKSSKLFDDSEASSDDEEQKDKERFQIRPEFEGKKGQKLINLQLSRPTADQRFKLDARFADSDSEEQDSDEEEKLKTEDVDVDATSEKQRALEILKGVVGAKAVIRPQKEKSKFRDINMLHYDPTQEGHEHFEVKQQPDTKKKSKKVKTSEPAIEPEPVPEVSKECFYEVAPSLKQVFEAGKEQTFSFASLFGNDAHEGETTDKERRAQTKQINEQAKAEPISTAGVLPWQQDNFVCDSSDDEEMMTRQKETREKLDARTLSIIHQAKRFLRHREEMKGISDCAGGSGHSWRSVKDQQEMFDDFLCYGAYKQDEIEAIEEQTRGQVENPLWFELRKGLITASSFKHFPRGVSETPCGSRAFAESFFNPRCKSYFSDAPQHRWGRIGEREARELYRAQERGRHKDLLIRETGLMMSREYPILGCSPDALVSCACHGTRLLEIKAPFSLGHLSAQKAAACRGCFQENGKWYLDKSATYFSQVQAQMGICGLTECDFLVYTTDISVVTVPFDPTYYKTMLGHLMTFYRDFMFEYLLQESKRLDKSTSEDGKRTKQKGASSSSKSGQLAASKLFFIANDPRIQVGIQSFCRPADGEAMRTKWEEERPGLVEAYRMKRKRVLRTNRGRTLYQPQAKRGRRK